MLFSIEVILIVREYRDKDNNFNLHHFIISNYIFCLKVNQSLNLLKRLGSKTR